MLATLSMPLSWWGALPTGRAVTPVVRFLFADTTLRAEKSVTHATSTKRHLDASNRSCDAAASAAAALGDRTRLAFKGCELEDTGREALIAKPTLLHPPLNVRSKPARVDLRNT